MQDYKWCRQRSAAKIFKKQLSNANTCLLRSHGKGIIFRYSSAKTTRNIYVIQTFQYRFDIAIFVLQKGLVVDGVKELLRGVNISISLLHSCFQQMERLSPK